MKKSDFEGLEHLKTEDSEGYQTSKNTLDLSSYEEVTIKFR